jgi:hypothetical protein
MDNRFRMIIALRVVAVVAMVVAVTLMWRVMQVLPWQVDCVIAGAMALAFAYRFEREEDSEGTHHQEADSNVGRNAG